MEFTNEAKAERVTMFAHVMRYRRAILALSVAAIVLGCALFWRPFALGSGRSRTDIRTLRSRAAVSNFDFRARVTYSNPRRRLLFVQDNTGSLEIDNYVAQSFEPGSLVEIEYRGAKDNPAKVVGTLLSAAHP